MGIGCDLELSLRPGSGYETSSTDSDSRRSSRALGWITNPTRNQQKQEDVTAVCHNGRICGCDATEMQGRAIICMAKREMEERFLAKRHNELTPASSSSSSQCSPSSPIARTQLLIGPGLSRKRSLQQFMQKRKRRIDASSPYNLVIIS